MNLTPSQRLLLERRLRKLRQKSSGAATTFSLILSSAIMAPVFLVLAGLAGAAIGYAILAEELDQGIKSIGEIADRDLFETTRIYDRNGVLLREVFSEGRRTYVKLGDVPESVIQATIAVEDEEFYENVGVDLFGIGRAALGELTGDNRGGGSTITQQLVRNVAFSYEERIARSYKRKIKEIVLALILTRQHGKDQILEWYLNEIYYGNLAYGIEAASKTIFDKSAKSLTLAEAALLVGLPQAPRDLDPLNPDPDVQRLVKNRQQTVLQLMVESGFISQKRADDAGDQPLIYNDPDDDLFLAPHFVVYVQKLLEERYGSERLALGGLNVMTSLDMRLQKVAEEVVAEHVDALQESKDLSNAALVAIEPATGQILAMVGSRDYWDDTIDGRVNVALAERQPGSSIKPITYLTALENGMPSSQVIWDVPMELWTSAGLYEPANYDEEFHGPVRLRRALANSYNIPALKVLGLIPPLLRNEDPERFDAYMADLPVFDFDPDEVDEDSKHLLQGVELTVATAHRMGISGLNRDPWEYGLSLTLGGGEVTLLDLTRVYATLANLGEKPKINPFLEINDSSGKALLDLKKDEGVREREQVVDERAAYIITDMLSDPDARTPSFSSTGPLSLGVPAAAKTGTTNDYRDNWTMGYTPYLATGVWAGNSDNSPMRDSSGVTGAAPIWNNFMRQVVVDSELRAIVVEAREDYGEEFSTQFKEPEGIESRRICRVESLRQPAAACQAYEKELFLEEFAPEGRAVVENPAPPSTEGEGEAEAEGDEAPADVSTEDDWAVENAVVVPLPPPPEEAILTAEEAGEELKWAPALLCQPGLDGMGNHKAQAVAVLPLPDDTSEGIIGEEKRFIVEWASEYGWPAIPPSEPCTQEMVDAALDVGALAGLPFLDRALFPDGFAPGFTPSGASYSLALEAGSRLTERTVLTGTVVYDPEKIDFYKVELSAGLTPGEWITIGDVHQGNVVEGPIEVLDAASLPPGPYILRLVLVQRDGNVLNPPYSLPIQIGGG